MLEDYQSYAVITTAFKNLDFNFYLPNPLKVWEEDAVQEELFQLLDRMEAELPPDNIDGRNTVYKEAFASLVQNLVNEYESAHPDLVHT